MNIKVHRGLEQIGGCITEISTATSPSSGFRLVMIDCNIRGTFVEAEETNAPVFIFVLKSDMAILAPTLPSFVKIVTSGEICE